MTTVIELPDDHNATLKTSEELSNKEVKLLRRAARKVGLTAKHLKDLGLDEVKVEEETPDEDQSVKDERNQRALTILTSLTDQEDDDLDLFQRTCAAVRLVEWNVDLPLPKTAEDVDNLPRPIYEALTREAAKLDLNESFTKEASMESADPKDQPTPDSSV